MRGQQLQQAARQRHELYDQQANGGQKQPLDRGASPHGLRAEALAERPGQGHRHRQNDQDQLAQGNPAAQQKGHEKDTPGQTAVHHPQQQCIEPAGIGKHLAFH
jgi:hypothetical protein